MSGSLPIRERWRPVIACPHCAGNTRVIDGRPSEQGTFRRRRECLACKKRFTTVERRKVEVSDLKAQLDVIETHLEYGLAKLRALRKETGLERDSATWLRTPDCPKLCRDGFDVGNGTDVPPSTP